MFEYAFTWTLCTTFKIAFNLTNIATSIQFYDISIITLLLSHDQNSIPTAGIAFHQLINLMKLFITICTLTGHGSLVKNIMQMNSTCDTDLLTISGHCLKAACEFHANSSVELVSSLTLITDTCWSQKVWIFAGCTGINVRTGFTV